MSLTFTAFHCKNCRVPLFTSNWDTYISTDVSNQYIFLDNSELQIHTPDNNLRCFECNAHLGIKLANNSFKIHKNKLTKITFTN